MQMQRTVWLALSYNLPINPSKVRVYVWRKLKEFGAEYFKQGVAILPNTAQGMQQFTALAQKIRELGGEASIVELRFTDSSDEAQMTARFKKQIEDEYRELLSDCANALREIRKPENPISQQESERIKQMIKRYRKTRSRDYFKTGGAAGEIEDGINEIIDSVRSVAADFGKQLRQLMET
ncbi:Chromate resistance protein ChrB [Anaerotruncus rubiinfantis]|uniref:Chromate resistance protein ChrB n=1 Tax=Anaerotruncus rubiinfantis TaxID=1720200 RepID=UPI00082C12FD|nr:Chromate resistance protein ChrB [Anaerotruncus rubiinfantis]